MIKNDCYKCKSSRNIIGEAHIACINPDPEMTGDAHGIKKGWFYYPLLFDPVWMRKECSNFEVDSVSNPVSGSVSN
jgi:hypothetical protein